MTKQVEMRAYTPPFEGEVCGLEASPPATGVQILRGDAWVEHSAEHEARFGLISNTSGAAAYVEVKGVGGGQPVEGRLVVQSPGAMPVELATGVMFGDALPVRPFTLTISDTVRLTLDGVLREIDVDLRAMLLNPYVATTSYENGSVGYVRVSAFHESA